VQYIFFIKYSAALDYAIREKIEKITLKVKQKKTIIVNN